MTLTGYGSTAASAEIGSNNNTISILNVGDKHGDTLNGASLPETPDQIFEVRRYATFRAGIDKVLVVFVIALFHFRSYFHSGKIDAGLMPLLRIPKRSSPPNPNRVPGGHSDYRIRFAGGASGLSNKDRQRLSTPGRFKEQADR